uniref:Ribosomal protein L19 n=1 Tax=Apophlaea sinclairii TaxID=212746 RepID=A0A1C9CBR9_9FLOR|nr:ribosomal protein L19 [Apophlaea sinclairii]AOM65815.1 ribosomal protein L19 [Apophlaea sinclairii]
MDFSVRHNYKIIEQIETKYLKNNIPKLNIGDVIQIQLLILEGNKERAQVSQGVVLSINRSNLKTTVTIRKILQRIGVEKVYLIHSPKIISIKVLKQSKVRRSKLFYLRGKQGKATKLKNKSI